MFRLFPRPAAVGFSLFVLVTLGGWCGEARAQATYMWNATGTTGAWLTAANWTGGVAGTYPGVLGSAGVTGTTQGAAPNGNPSDLASFSSSTAAPAATIAFATGSTFLSLGAIQANQAGTAVNYAISNNGTAGGFIQLNGGAPGLAPTTLIDMSGAGGNLSFTAGTGTTALGLVLGRTDGVFNVVTGRTLTVNSIISQAATGSRLFLQGGGTVVLTNTTNSFTGGVEVTGGTTLTLASILPTGTAPAAAVANFITLDNGIIRQTGNFGVTNSNRGFTLGAGGGTIDTTTGFTATIGGNITGAGRLTVTGTGTVTLDGTNTHGGNTVTGGATLVPSAIGGLGGSATLNPSQILLDNGTIRFPFSNTTTLVSVNRGVQLGTGGGTVDIPDVIVSNQAAVYANVPGQTGSLTKTGTGTLGLRAVSTYTGTTTLAPNGGTLTLAGTGSILQTTTAITIGTNATLNLANNLTTGSTDNSANRVPDAVPITLNGGALALIGNAAANTTETVGATTVGNGPAAFSITPVTTRTAALTLGNATTSIILARTAPGTTLTFTTAANGTFNVPGSVPVTNGIIAGYAVFTNGTATAFATKTGTTIGALTTFGTATGDNVRTSDLGGGLPPAAVNSLTIDTAATLALTGALTVNSGGILATATSSISGGSLASGLTTATTTDLVFHTVGAAVTLTVSTLLADIGSTLQAVTKSGAGTLTLVGPNTYTGPTAINGGSLIVNRSDSFTYPGVISGPGNYTLTGGGNLTFGTTANTYAGSTSVLGGSTLTVAGGQALGNSPSATAANLIVLDNGTLSSTADFTPSVRRGLGLGAGGGTLRAAAGTTLTYGGIAANLTASPGALNVTGPGTVTLSGASTYTGPTTVTGGATLNVTTLAAGAAASPVGQSAADAANLVLDNGTLTVTPASTTAITTDRLLTVGPGGATINSSAGSSAGVTFSATGPVVLSGTGPHTLAFGGTNASIARFNPVISDKSAGEPTTVTRSGSVIWTLGGANTYTGPTLIPNGTFRPVTSTSLGINSAVTVGAAGRIQVNGIPSLVIGSLSGDGGGSVGNGGANSNTSILTVGGNNLSTSYAGRLFDNSINAGTTFSPVFGLVKTGTGSLTLNNVVTTGLQTSSIGPNVYTGTTAINSGAVYVATPTGVTGLGSSAVSVNGGTLGGTGDVILAATAGVAVNPGGTIRGGFPSTAPGGAAGTNIGTLTIAGGTGATLVGAPGTGGAALAVDFNGAPQATPSASTTSLLNLTSGTLNFDKTAGPVVIALVGDGGLTLNTPYTATVATSTGGFALNGTVLTSPYTYTYDTDWVIQSSSFATFDPAATSLSISGNNLILTATPLTPVPEPASILGLASAGLGIAGWVRRRRTRA